MLKTALKRIFNPPPLQTLILATIGYAAVLAVPIFKIELPAYRYTAYLLSAYALVITVTGLKYLGPAFASLKRRFFESRPIKKLRSTKIGERYFNDVRFRAGIALYFGLAVNVCYIAPKLWAGIKYRSAWFCSLAVYYVLLALMRLLLAGKTSLNERRAEVRLYRACGIILLLMNQALAGIVIFIVNQDRAFDYPGNLIYAMAFYSFYAVITASVGIVRTRRHQSPVLSAAKAVNLVAALVSLLSLTTALLARFGGNDAPEFRKAMTASVGGGVCTVVIVMAAYMIIRSTGELKRIRKTGQEK